MRFDRRLYAGNDLIPVPFIVRNAKRLKAIKERLTFVEGEIAKLDAALGRGVAEI